MNARPAHESELLAKVALAALIGAGLAALVVRRLWSIDPLVLAVVVLAAVVFCLLTAARRTPPPRRTVPQPAYRPAHQPTYLPTVDPAYQPAPAAPFSWGQPAPAMANGGVPGWRPGAPPAETAAADTYRPVAAAAVSVRDGTRVPIAAAGSVRAVQCPRCGDFSVDVAHRAPSFAFRCRCCAAEWQWRPGTSWPVSVVRSVVTGKPAARPGIRSS